MTPFLINVDATARNGLLKEFESTTYAELPTFTNIETVSRGFRLVESGANLAVRPWDEIDMSTTGSCRRADAAALGVASPPVLSQTPTEPSRS